MPNVKILLNININIYIVYAFFILTNYLTDHLIFLTVEKVKKYNNLFICFKFKL